MDQSDLHARLIAYVAEHGTAALLSERARREQTAFQRRLQAIMDGPIPQQTQKHSALLREREQRASH